MIAEVRYHDLMAFPLKSLFESRPVADPNDALVRLVRFRVPTSARRFKRVNCPAFQETMKDTN
jgi:hypothetical protein